MVKTIYKQSQRLLDHPLGLVTKWRSTEWVGSRPRDTVPTTHHRFHNDKEKARSVRANDMRSIRRGRNCPFLRVNACCRDIPEHKRVPRI